MVTRTTSLRLTKLSPSKVESAPVPEVSPPPWIQSMTGLEELVLSLDDGRDGV